jgi:hypothetical protein
MKSLQKDCSEKEIVVWSGRRVFSFYHVMHSLIFELDDDSNDSFLFALELLLVCDDR